MASLQEIIENKVLAKKQQLWREVENEFDRDPDKNDPYTSEYYKKIELLHGKVIKILEEEGFPDALAKGQLPAKFLDDAIFNDVFRLDDLPLQYTPAFPPDRALSLVDLIQKEKERFWAEACREVNIPVSSNVRSDDLQKILPKFVEKIEGGIGCSLLQLIKTEEAKSALTQAKGRLKMAVDFVEAPQQKIKSPLPQNKTPVESTPKRALNEIQLAAMVIAKKDEMWKVAGSALSANKNEGYQFILFSMLIDNWLKSQGSSLKQVLAAPEAKKKLEEGGRRINIAIRMYEKAQETPEEKGARKEVKKAVERGGGLVTIAFGSDFSRPDDLKEFRKQIVKECRNAHGDKGIENREKLDALIALRDLIDNGTLERYENAYEKAKQTPPPPRSGLS